MSRYIDAEKAERDGWTMQRTFQSSPTEMTCEMKKPTDMPFVTGTSTDLNPVTYAPVRHGRWFCADDFYESGVCSECKWNSGVVHGICVKEWNYCPNCGALMKGE